MSYDEYGEWHCAVDDMTEFERAPYDDPEIYADTMGMDGVRWP